MAKHRSDSRRESDFSLGPRGWILAIGTAVFGPLFLIHYVTEGRPLAAVVAGVLSVLALLTLGWVTRHRGDG